MDRLYEEYDTVSYNGEVRNISKLLKKIQKNYTHFVVLGSNEELKNELEEESLINQIVCHLFLILLLQQ